MIVVQNPSERRRCPWCEGKTVVGQLVHGEEPDSVTVLGVKIPIIGTMLDKRCEFCKGEGSIPRSQSQADRWAEIHAERTAAEAARKEAKS